MLKVVENRSPALLTAYDVAQISQSALTDAALRLLGDEIDVDDAADLLLAEAVRRFVVNDKSPPGGQNQLQQFDFAEIASELRIEMSDREFDSAMETLHGREAIRLTLEGADGLKSADGSFFLSFGGIERGLALIDKFVPRPRVSTQPIDSTAWTGRYHLSETQKQGVRGILGEMRTVLAGARLSNFETANAIALIEAAEILIETPDPLWPEIMRLLRSPVLGNVTGIAALVLTIGQILTAAAS